MKKLLSIAVSGLFFSAISSLQVANAESLYPVEVTSKTPSVKISKIKIQKLNQLWVLSGVVKRRSYNSAVLPGHIDVTIVKTIAGAQAQILSKDVVDYSPSLSLRRWRSGSRFNLTLPNDLPAGSTIKLKWHKNQSKKHVLSQLIKSQSAWL